MLPSEMLQELFFDCVESVLQIKKKEERIKHLDTKTSVNELLHDGSENEKAQVVMNFISKPSVMQSLYDLMFLERRSNRTQSGTTRINAASMVNLCDEMGNGHNINILSGEAPAANDTNLSLTTIPRGTTRGEVLNGDGQGIQTALNNFAIKTRPVMDRNMHPSQTGYA